MPDLAWTDFANPRFNLKIKRNIDTFWRKNFWSKNTQPRPGEPTGIGTTQTWESKISGRSTLLSQVTSGIEDCCGILMQLCCLRLRLYWQAEFLNNLIIWCKCNSDVNAGFKIISTKWQNCRLEDKADTTGLLCLRLYLIWLTDPKDLFMSASVLPFSLWRLHSLIDNIHINANCPSTKQTFYCWLLSQ